MGPNIFLITIVNPFDKALIPSYLLFLFGLTLFPHDFFRQSPLIKL